MRKLPHTRFSLLPRLLAALGLGITLLLGGVSTANAQSWFLFSGPAIGPDNQTRIVWQRGDNAFTSWLVNPAGGVESSPIFGPYTGWRAIDVAATTDNKTRLLWRRDFEQAPDQAVALWAVNASGVVESTYAFGPYPDWRAYNIAVGPDNKTRVLWRRNDETAALWTVSPEGAIESSPTFGPFLVEQGPEWRAIDVAVGPDNKTRILWRRIAPEDGAVSLWTVNESGGIESTYRFGPYPGWRATSTSGISVGSDNRTRLLWRRDDQAITVWSVNPAGTIESSPIFGPFAGWLAQSIAVGPDNGTRVLWLRNDQAISLWSINPFGGIESTYLFGPY